ncbi:MAG: flagellar hook-length control protein FliK [Bacteriovoracia bacterium]
MIQAPVTKPIEAPKAKPKEAESPEVASNKKAPKAQGTKQTQEADAAEEFATELETSLSKNEVKVAPVQVSAEQALELPSTLVQPASVDTTSPKVFDPELTKDVQKLVGPKTTEAPVPLTDAEVLELAKGNVEAPVKEAKAEFTQAMLKTPQVKQPTGRAPAIDFAKAEIDPQLLNNEDFVAQKNLATKKAVPNAYGMKVIPQQQQKVALEAGLQQTQVVKEGAEASAVNSQDFILGLTAGSEPKLQQSLETQVAPKVFDMNHIKSSDSNEVINQITDYVVQAKAAKEPTVNMRVNHEDLGMIDITVTKSGANHEAIAVNIGTHSVDGKNFFHQNSKDLFSHLTNAGLTVSDLKVETPTQTASRDFDLGSQSGKGQQGSEKQFGSEQNQRRHESERRQDLWKLLNQEAA